MPLGARSLPGNGRLGHSCTAVPRAGICRKFDKAPQKSRSSRRAALPETAPSNKKTDGLITSLACSDPGDGRSIAMQGTQIASLRAELFLRRLELDLALDEVSRLLGADAAAADLRSAVDRVESLLLQVGRIERTLRRVHRRTHGTGAP